MRDAIERDVAEWPADRPFSLRPHMQRVTLEVILKAVFGIRGSERERRAARLVSDFAHRADLVTQVPALRRDLGRWSPWVRFKRARAELDAFIYEEIADRRAAEDGAERDDVLSLLLAAEHDDGSPMSDRELRDELVTVLGAGHETTATALAWAFERLLRTPRVMTRLRESIDAGEDDYLDATIKEALRARPVIVDVARKLSAPAEVGGYELPAGTFVLPAIAAMHYREDLFPEPFEFRPERFIDGKADTYAWIPFGGGVRRCVGAAFAQYEMRVIMKTILERTELRAPDPAPERIGLRNITLAPGKGTRVELVARALEVVRRDRRLRLAVEPLLEVLVEALELGAGEAADLLGERDELARSRCCRAEIGLEALGELEELGMADDLAVALEGHRAAHVDGEVGEEVRRVAVERPRARSPSPRRRRSVYSASNCCLRRPTSRLTGFAPVPLRPDRPALVEPDVGPGGERDRVAEPLVRELVEQRAARGGGSAAMAKCGFVCTSSA